MLWIFPGQPLKPEPAVPDDDDFYAIKGLCRERCGFDLSHHLPLSGLTLSNHTCLQIYGVAISLYRARRLRETGITPDLIAEHSLGIYAALAAAGCLGEGDLLELVCRVGGAMAAAFTKREYALGCVIGLPVALLESVARNNRVFVANYNTSRHFLLAGEKSGIAAALVECQAAGAFSVSSFSCEAPLHTPLLAELSAELRQIVAGYRFREPLVPLVEHINQTRLTAATIPPFLVDQLLEPVHWEQTWKHLRATGFNRCIEVGSGQMLTKFNRWIDSEGNLLTSCCQ